MKPNCHEQTQIGPTKRRSAGTLVRDIEETDMVIRPGSSPGTENEMKMAGVSGRRGFLRVAGAGLVAASIPTAAGALTGSQKGDDQLPVDRSRPIYLHGCGWNRALPGVFGEVCLAFDIRAELGGTGVGTLRDDVYPEVNSQVQINSATQHGNEYTLEGQIIASRDPANVGRAISIVAQSLGNGQGSAVITIGTLASSPNLVVNAIIAVLIALLVPAPQPFR